MSDWLVDSLLLISTVVLVVVNGFFVSAEFALIKVRHARLQALSRQKRLFAKTADWLAERLEASISACQLGITMASLGLGWIGEPALADLLEPAFEAAGLQSEQLLSALAFTIAFAVITAAHLVAGEQAPKLFSIRNPEPVLLWCAIPLKGFYILTYPFLKLFSNRPCTTWGGRGTSARTDAGGPMRAYSMDLRERARLDSDAGMKAADVAAKYRVSGSWVRLLKQRRRETGEVAPRVQRHGRRGMLEPHLHPLAALIAAHPDRTLAELNDALATPARMPTVWRAVRALGLTVNKNGPPVRTRSA